MSLYGWLLLGTLLGPLSLSFDRKVAFYRSWKHLFPAILLVSIIFLVWDVFFTQSGVWGFNEKYVSGIYVLSLPLEEVLFFLIVPFACLFIYEVVKNYFPQLKLHFFARVFGFALGALAFTLTVSYLNRWYTLVACGTAFLLVSGIYFKLKASWFPIFSLAYLISTIPFLIVNGALTGFFTQEPVVWYNEAQFSGIRIGTIPLEDLFYNFDLLILVTALYEYGKNRKNP